MKLKFVLCASFCFLSITRAMDPALQDNKKGDDTDIDEHVRLADPVLEPIPHENEGRHGPPPAL